MKNPAAVELGRKSWAARQKKLGKRKAAKAMAALSAGRVRSPETRAKIAAGRRAAYASMTTDELAALAARLAEARAARKAVKTRPKSAAKSGPSPQLVTGPAIAKPA